MNLGSRRVRLKAIWLLLIPFLFLARPTPRLLLIGGSLAALGTVIRAWAAGCIKKDRELAVTGPYAHTRNPLYLGSMVIGLGVTIAGGWWVFIALFLLFFFVVYRRTMKNEEKLLEAEFGDTYRRYREAVPAIVPRLTPYRAARSEARGTGTVGSGARPWRFSPRRYLKNREWEAALGVAAGFAFLAIKMVW